MLRTRLPILLVAGAIVAAAAATASAQCIIPRPPHPPPIRPVPRPHPVFTIASQHVDVDIDRQVALTTIEQTFRNETRRDQEGIYLFPIPEGASVSRFTMWINGEEVEGEVVDARRARAIYEDIVRHMRDPALLEFVGQGLFRARVYPIPARGEVTVKLEYERILEYDAGAVRYQLPVRAARVCYRPPDHDWGHRDRRRPDRFDDFSLRVTIASDTPIRSVYSPTHDIDTKLEGKRATCGLEGRALTSDFVLYYTVSDADVGLNLITHRVDGDDGYFMMLLSPGRVTDDARILAKDVVFVLDTSGSMQGKKIDQARDALAYCVERLREDDRFNIVAFATAINRFEEALVPANRRNRRRALAFVDDLSARGGTDIDGALRAALELPRSTRPRMVVFLTDGLPTVGEKDVRKILANLRDENDAGARIFPFGVGYDVNTVLLDQMSEDHRGSVDYIRPEEDIEDRVSRFYHKVESPVLSDLELDVSDVDLNDVYPRVLPDLFDGSQLVLVGRYRGHGGSAIRLSGYVGDESRQFEYEGTFRRRERGNDFIPRLWATRKINYLLSEIKMNGKDPELVDEIIALSLDYGIITPYTSFLILEDGTEYDRTRLGRVAPESRLREFADAPAAERMATLNVPRADMARGGAAMKQVVSGQAATRVSRDLTEGKTATRAREDDAAVRVVDARRFILKDGEWIESTVTDDMEVVEVEFLGEAYFALIDQHPEIARVMALGERVTFALDGRAYRVVP